MGLPRDRLRDKGQKQKGALKMCLPRLGCQHVLLSSREQAGRQEEKLSQSCFLNQIYRDTVKQGRVTGEGRLNKLIANQTDCHERPQPMPDFQRETPNPNLSPADQLGAATVSALSVPLQGNQLQDHPSPLKSCSSKGRSYLKWSSLFFVCHE